MRASLIFWSHQIPYPLACFTIPTQPAYHFRRKELRTRHQHNTPNLGKADAMSLHPLAVRRHRKLIARVFFSFSLHTTVLATFFSLVCCDNASQFSVSRCVFCACFPGRLSLRNIYTTRASACVGMAPLVLPYHLEITSNHPLSSTTSTAFLLCSPSGHDAKSKPNAISSDVGERASCMRW